jgi:hypothetical protein
MFRKFLFLSAGVLTVICAAGFPDQAHAQRGRGGFRPGGFPQMRQASPGFNQPFMNSGFGMSRPNFREPFMNSGFGMSSPGFGQPFMAPLR